MRRARGVVLVAGLAAGAACTGGGGNDDRAEPPEPREELARRIGEYEQALLAGEPGEVKGFWSDDARVLLPGLDLQGPGVASFVDDFYAAGGEVIAVEFSTDDLFVHDGAAYELGRYEETARLGGRETESVRGNYFLRWERGADGRWRIDRFVAGPVDPAGER